MTRTVSRAPRKRPTALPDAIVIRRLLTGLVGWLLVACATMPAAMACTVGSGMGCTEALLNACLPGGGNYDGTVVFDCGGAATITVTSTKTISMNTTIDGGGVITIDGGSSVHVFIVNSAITLNLQKLTIANAKNTSSGANGGAISNSGTLNVTACTFSANTANGTGNPLLNIAQGGAIFSDTFSTLNVTDSTFANNVATAVPVSPSGHSIDQGGAIYLAGAVTAIITGSTFSGNSVSSVGSGSEADHGGAIFNEESTLTLTNCTFINNTTSGADSRGGALMQSAATTTITNCTFNQPTTTSLGSSFYTLGNTLSLTNTIVSGHGPDCATQSTSISDGGHNIEDGNSCGFTGTGCSNTSGTSFCNTDPLLDPTGLATNGGPTQTDALCTAMGAPPGCSGASPAINAGDETVCSMTTGTAPVNNVDQRGFVRPGMGHVNCCIGAFEADSNGPPAPTATATPTNTATATETATTTITETATVTSTATQTATTTNTATATATATITSTPTTSSTATISSTATATATITSTPTATRTATATSTSTPTATATVPSTPTATPSPQPNGASCSSTNQCQSTFCVDGVCCDTVCDGPTQRCDLPGRRGTCTTANAAPTLTPWGLVGAALLLVSIAAFALRRRALRP